MRTRIALNLKGVAYEFLPQIYGTKRELVAKYNPVYKKIPVLLHKGKPLAESMIIVEYIDEVWSSTAPLLPTDPYDRAVERFWTTYFDDKWFSSLKAAAILADKEEEKATATEYVFTVLHQLGEAFRSCSKGKDFFGGDTIGYLDIAVGSHLGWLTASEKMTGIKFLNEEKTPGLLRWAERFCSHSAVKELMPKTENLIEFAHLLRAKLKAEADARGK